MYIIEVLSTSAVSCLWASLEACKWSFSSSFSITFWKHKKMLIIFSADFPKILILCQTFLEQPLSCSATPWPAKSAFACCKHWHAHAACHPRACWHFISIPLLLWVYVEVQQSGTKGMRSLPGSESPPHSFLTTPLLSWKSEHLFGLQNTKGT